MILLVFGTQLQIDSSGPYLAGGGGKGAGPPRVIMGKVPFYEQVPLFSWEKFALSS